MTKVLQLENKKDFYFKNTNEDIIMTGEDEDDSRKTDICLFCARNIESDKVRDHCLPYWNGQNSSLAFVIILSHRNKAIFFHFYFTISVKKIVIIF